MTQVADQETSPAEVVPGPHLLPGPAPVLPVRPPAARDGLLAALTLLVLLGGGVAARVYSYPLFHTLVEFFSITIGVGVFLVAWHTRRWHHNGYLTFLAVGCLFVAALDLVHTLAYKGLGIFPGRDANLPTQLWIAARVMQALTFLLTPFLFRRRVSVLWSPAAFSLLTALLLACIFAGWFPTCFVEGAGLTAFKRGSEYAICVLLVAASATWYVRRQALSPPVRLWLQLALAVTVLQELTFTLYHDPFGPWNLLGHVLKVVAFYCIYRGIVQTALARPYDLLLFDLKQSEERWAALAQATFEGVVLSENSLILDVNPQMANLLGYAPAEVIGCHVASFIAPEDIPRVLAHLRAGHETTIEYALLHRDGSRILVESHGHTVDYQNRRVRVSAVRDITARQRDRAEILRNDARLESLARIAGFRAESIGELLDFALAEALALTGSPIGFVCGYDPATRQITLHNWSRSVREQCRLPQVPATWHLDQTGLWGEAIRAGRPLLLNDFAAPHPLKQGLPAGHLPLQRLLTVPVSLDGRIVGVVGVANKPAAYDAGDIRQLTLLMDSTWKMVERERAEEALRHAHAGLERQVQERTAELAEHRQHLEDLVHRRTAELTAAKEAAEAANRTKDEFLAVLSHELRTPLSPALLIVAEQAQNPAVPEAVRHELTTAQRNIELETRLIDDLLDLSRVMAGKLRMYPQVVSAQKVLRRALDICAGDIEARQIQLEQQFLAGEDAVQADPARLQQVFWNLLKNAVKFTLPGGRIMVTCRNLPERRVQIQIRDTGVGIAPEALGRIFSAFEQADTSVSRQFGGLGLGLAISKLIVDLHGGTIRAESPGADQGATFTVELPRAAAPAAASGPARAPAPAATAGESKSENQKSKLAPPLRLLLVEDHPDTARTLARLLRTSGHQVQTAASITAARQILAAEPFDLLLSDLGLPDGTGYELMEQARARFGLAGLCMSGYGMETDVQKSRAAGFAAHLTKPINFEVLEQTIRQFAPRS